MSRSYFDDFLANDGLRSRIGSRIESGRLAHAYILEGRRGFGKHMLALRIFAALACKNRHADPGAVPCMRCAACKKIMAGNNPDIRYIRREGTRATLGIESVRFLAQDVLMNPIESPYKCYVIEDAHLLTPQAQNALLLTLEEPPEYVIFMLLCEQTETILETIRSRAPVLRLQPAKADTIREYLKSAVPQIYKSIPEEELKQLILLAGGSIGRALELTDAKTRKAILQNRESADELLRCCVDRPGAAEAYAKLKNLGTNRADIDAVLVYLSDALRDLILLKKSDTVPLLFFTDRSDASELAGRIPLKTLRQLWSAVLEARGMLAQNANTALTVARFGVQTSILNL